MCCCFHFVMCMFRRTVDFFSLYDIIVVYKNTFYKSDSIINQYITTFKGSDFMSSHSHREQKRHSTMLIPYSFLYGVMPDYYPSIGVHCHPEFEMFVFNEGRCHFQIGDRFFTAQAGDVVLVQPDVLHGAEPIDGERVAYDIVLFHPQLMTGGIEDRAYQEIWLPLITGDLIADAPINIEHPYYTQIFRAAEHAVTCVRNPNIQNELLLRSSLMELFFLLLDSRSIHSKSELLPQNDSVLLPVTDYIKANYAELLTVEQLADIVHLSKSYFMGLFRKTYGMSAIAYVHRIRMEAVCELLKNSDDSITDIAIGCGYPSIANFNRHFMKEVGMTPSEYRKRSEKQDENRIASKISIYDMRLNEEYDNLVAKATRRGYKQSDVDAIIRWLTGYTQKQLAEKLDADISYQEFFEQAPQINPDAKKIKGLIGGMRVEIIEEPLMQQIRWLEKLVDELVRGRNIQF